MENINFKGFIDIEPKPLKPIHKQHARNLYKLLISNEPIKGRTLSMIERDRLNLFLQKLLDQ